MSSRAKKIQKYYEAGWYSKNMMKNLVKKKAITEEEYEEIVGEKYND